MKDQSVEIILSGKDNPRPADVLIDGFAKSKQSICAVIYKFDEEKIFDALKSVLDNKKEVKVRLVVDKRIFKKICRNIFENSSFMKVI